MKIKNLKPLSSVKTALVIDAQSCKFIKGGYPSNNNAIAGDPVTV